MVQTDECICEVIPLILGERTSVECGNTNLTSFGEQFVHDSVDCVFEFCIFLTLSDEDMITFVGGWAKDVISRW